MTPGPCLDGPASGLEPHEAGPVDVLLLEDDYDLRDAMTDVLELGGYRTVAVFNGLEALEWLADADHRPSLILLDLMMPVMDGWQFREEQLKNPALASIPVAVLSARGDTAMGDGVGCLKKPVRSKDLLAFVERFCAKR
jgi:CheY-like chemotaxis protein